MKDTKLDPETKFNKQSDVPQGCKVIKTKNDPRFGMCKILQNITTGQEYILIEDVFYHKEAAEKLIDQLENRLTLNSSHVQKLVDWACSSESHFCSKSYNIRAFYENTNYDLEDIINETKKDGVLIDQSDLIFITYQMMMAIASVNKRNFYVEDMRPCYIGKENDEIKHNKRNKKENCWILLDRLVNPKSADQVQKKHYKLMDDIYMSPALFKGLNQQVEKIYHDRAKSDTWSLGLSILEAGILNSVQGIYDRKSGNIDLRKLEELKNRFYENYQDENL